MKTMQSGTDVLKIETLKLRCKLTLDEQRERGKELALVSTALGAMKAEHKDMKADMTRKETLKQAELDRLARDVREGEETRAVECEVRADFARGQAITYRLDTGAEVDRRPLEYDERQTVMRGMAAID